MAYYNTLGFDRELIDYIEFVSDDFVYDLVLPLFKKGGRPPHNPVMMFRAHYLYFAKQEVSSYRQLEKVLKNPKNQDYRNFIGAYSIKEVPSHSSMSEFRKKVGVENFYQILFQLLAQALQVEGFLQTNMAAIDSRPLYANVAGPKKKRCNCTEQENCSCQETFTDPDAAVGTQRNKTNMNKYFVGYRKHTIICRSELGPVPLISIIQPANVPDVKVLLPLIEKLKQVENLKLEYLVADLGYYDLDTQTKAFGQHNVIVTTPVKNNTVLPEGVTKDLKVLCPEGHPMVWDGFDKNEFLSWFRGDEMHCRACLYSSTCQKFFSYSYFDNPLVFSPVPQGTRLHKEMQNFRKQAELNFAQESNDLDHKMRHKKLPVRGLARVQIFAVMADIFRLIKLMLNYCREKFVPENRDALLIEAQKKQFIQRKAA
jgi:transposase